MFSLVVFARRPLRFSELRESIWCLQSKSTDILRLADRPFLQRLHEVARPLIEIVKADDGLDEEDDYICRLSHSTLRDFLLKNPYAFCEDGQNSPDLCIDVRLSINACMIYLGQSRFDTLLVKHDGHWEDKDGIPAESHHFLKYAAKYWDKHLGDAIDTQYEELSKTIEAFMASPNFLTCLQVQSLWIQMHFALWQIEGKAEGYEYLRRLLPRWFVETQAGHTLWLQFRRFLHEWRHFLDTGSAAAHVDHITHHTGDLCQIWFEALGASSFLSRSRSHYSSFILPSNQDFEPKLGYFCDGIGEGGREIYVLRTQ